MRVYSPTKKGRQIVSRVADNSSEEMRVLRMLTERKMCDEDELGTDRWRLRKMQENGLITEITGREERWSSS